MISDELLLAALPHGGVDWRAPSRASHPARDAGFASYDAVCRHDKEAWLALWTEDGWVEDPVGVSPIDGFTACGLGMGPDHGDGREHPLAGLGVRA